jgi:hypothetical protein
MIRNQQFLMKLMMIRNTSCCCRLRSITHAQNTKGRLVLFVMMVPTTSTHFRTCPFGLCCWYINPLSQLTLTNHFSMKGKRHATITHPPEKLNLADKHGTQLAVQKRAHMEPAPNPPMPWLMPYPYMQTAWPSQVSFQTTNSGDTSSDKLPAKPRAIKFPPISDWLASLDCDANHGEDNLNYSQYADALHQNGIIQLDNLFAVQTAEKLQVLGEMNWGTASRLLGFAEEDRDDLLCGK